jgi:cation:H+ antiporter
MDALILLVSLVIILVGAELFTNGIEWLGKHFNLGEGAVGSVLAAVGTALPETMIPLVAIVFAGGTAGTEVGVGAILGAPFMLATLAMFVTGVAVFVFRGRRAAGTRVQVDMGLVSRDARAFFVIYAIAIGAAFLPAELRPFSWVVAVALVLLYAGYVRSHLRDERADDLEDPGPLRLRRLSRTARREPDWPPHLWVVALQVIVALSCIIVGAVFFVGAVERVAANFGIDGTLLALVIAPIATELPEKFNSVLWVRQGKDNLALGNISGAMVFQAAVPPSIALVFAPQAWVIGPDTVLAFFSAAIAMASLAVIVVPALRRGRLSAMALLTGGAFYVLYLGLVLATMAGSG